MKITKDSVYHLLNIIKPDEINTDAKIINGLLGIADNPFHYERVGQTNTVEYRQLSYKDKDLVVVVKEEEIVRTYTADKYFNNILPHHEQKTQCAGKYKYSSPQKAWNTLSHLTKKKRRREKSDKAINVYQCPHCKLWHIGHDLLQK